MHHHVDAATLLRQRAAEIDRMVVDHHRRTQANARRQTRRTSGRVLALLRSS